MTKNLHRMSFNTVTVILTVLCLGGGSVFGSGTPKDALTKIKWTSYRSQSLKVQMTVPAAWNIRKTPVALGFRSSASSSQAAAVGIMQSKQPVATIEDVTKLMFKQAHYPKDWKTCYTTIAGMRAMEIVGADPLHANRKIVQYVIQTPETRYLLQCFAPQALWPTYKPIFLNILNHIQFL